uniref:OSJNBa0091C07.6 protein n=1 Tax=Oryza sativa subsp. japonica TaxID=39947 RepID=Q7XK58_ORYSJ|nr:OSJNBa0091C07.6 [Oryza sativa Japonica Group]
MASDLSQSLGLNIHRQKDYIAIKSTGTLTNLKARFWTCIEVKQIFQASVCFSHQHAFGMPSGKRQVTTMSAEKPSPSSASKPPIPPKTELAFGEASVKDICKYGDIFKKVLAEGHKWENPKELDKWNTTNSKMWDTRNVYQFQEDVKFF